MNEKLQVFFDPKSKKQADRLIYQKVFELREKRPKDFVMSSAFSMLMDATEKQSKVFLVELPVDEKRRIFMEFKRMSR
jgi:hypothetical protein